MPVAFQQAIGMYSFSRKQPEIPGIFIPGFSDNWPNRYPLYPCHLLGLEKKGRTSNSKGNIIIGNEFEGLMSGMLSID